METWRGLILTYLPYLRWAEGSDVILRNALCMVEGLNAYLHLALRIACRAELAIRPVVGNKKRVRWGESNGA